jgi:beta-lactamase class A
MGFKRVGVFIVVGVLLFGGGFIANSIVNKPTPATSGQTDYNNYPFLAKRLFLENPNESIINFSPLRQSVRKYFSDNQLNGSLYFEYLPTGTSVRVNGDQEYRAASLIKLPVAMELYKAHELGKLQLDQKVTLKQEWLNDSYGNLYKKGAGYELTLEEAVRIMLVDSDNTALRAVIDATDKVLDLNNRALGSLDIEFTQSNDESINIGTRSYSSFLKCLYFACYNDKEHSQEILKLLTETKFNNRIVAGIGDKDVKVAHKIGVFNTQVQSDCGIVYLPNGNYVLCAMIV